MKAILTISTILFFFLPITAQRYDYQWPMGYGSNFALDFGISMLDFNNQNVNAYPFIEIDDFELGEAGSFICDENGNVMLMTNNCKVVAANFQTIEGGDTLTPGYTYDNYCHMGGYPSLQATLFLPEFSNDSTVYLIHNDVFLSNLHHDAITQSFYISTIIHSGDQTFYLKEKKLMSEEIMIPGRVTAGLHADGDKWWTWSHGYETDRFYKFLIGGDTIQGPFIQDIGPEANTTELDGGQTAFSPNMEMLALNSRGGILLFDFDNATGILSNYQVIPYFGMENPKGLVFSPDSRFIYVSTADNLYQIDLNPPPGEEQVVHIAYVWEPDETGWPIGIGEMFIGPDCRIYVAPASSTYYIHTIHLPNEKGIACQFQKKAIRMPTNLLFRFPNLPMYRFNGACDPDIEWGFPTSVAPEPEAAATMLRVYPNPARDEVVVELAEGNGYQALQICDLTGRIVRTYALEEGQRQLHLDLSGLLPGLYFVSPEGEAGKAVKLVISR